MALTPQQLSKLRKASVGPSGNRLAAAIEIAEITQTALGEAIELPHTYVSDVKCGRFSTITLDNAYKFCSFFGCAIEDLFPSREAVAS